MGCVSGTEMDDGEGGRESDGQRWDVCKYWMGNGTTKELFQPSSKYESSAAARVFIDTLSPLSFTGGF